MEDEQDLAAKEARRRKVIARRKRKYDELVARAVEILAWLNNDSDDDEEIGEMRVGESRRDVSWIWKAAGSMGTDADFEDALRIEWSKVYAQARRWNEEVRLLKEEFRQVPISLEFEADRWVERAKAVLVGTGGVDEASAQGMIAYALKQEAMYRDIAARIREAESAPKIARGKKRPRVPIVDPLAQQLGTKEGEDDDDGDMGLREEDDDDVERGVMESDEELVMGGDIDDM
ncbi:hypothetical protein B0H14DRAFT_2633027 [Mycena olivaceomarginata]|nr:hypothetical protein B0H14DRAFT_2633027 [Mycena olivaceomarginata]